VIEILAVDIIIAYTHLPALKIKTMIFDFSNLVLYYLIHAVLLVYSRKV